MATARRRALADDALRVCGRALGVGAGLAAVLVVLVKLRALSGEGWALWSRGWVLLAGPVAVALGMGAGVAWARRWSVGRAAREVDERLWLKSALTSGLEFSGRESPTAFEVLAMNEAERAAGRVDVARAVPVRLGREWAVWALALVAVGVALQYVPTRPATRREAREHRLSQERAEATREIARAIESVKGAAEGEPAPVADGARARELSALREIERALSGKEVSAGEARARAAQAVSDVAERLDREVEAKRAVLDAAKSAAARAAAGVDGGGAGGESGPLREALMRGDAEGAAEAVERIAERAPTLSGEERERLSREFAEMAESLREGATGVGEAGADESGESGVKEEAGSAESLSRALREAAEALRAREPEQVPETKSGVGETKEPERTSERRDGAGGVKAGEAAEKAREKETGEQPEARRPGASEPKSGAQEPAQEPKSVEAKPGAEPAAKPGAARAPAGESGRKPGEKSGGSTPQEPGKGERRPDADKPGQQGVKPEGDGSKPSETKGGDPKSGEPSSGQPRPGDSKPGDSKPSEPRSGESKPGGSKPGVPKVGDVKPEESRPGNPASGERGAGEQAARPDGGAKRESGAKPEAKGAAEPKSGGKPETKSGEQKGTGEQTSGGEQKEGGERKGEGASPARPEGEAGGDRESAAPSGRKTTSSGDSVAKDAGKDAGKVQSKPEGAKPGADKPGEKGAEEGGRNNAEEQVGEKAGEKPGDKSGVKPGEKGDGDRRAGDEKLPEKPGDRGGEESAEPREDAGEEKGPGRVPEKMPSAEALEQLAERFKDLHKMAEGTRMTREQAERMRRRAQEMLESASPEERRRLAELAEKLSGRGEGTKGEMAREPGGGESRETAGDHQGEGGHDGGGAGDGSMKPGSRSAGPIMKPGSMPSKTMDARAAGSRRERTIAQWYRDQQPGGDKSVSRESLSEGFKDAAVGVERAIEQQDVPTDRTDFVRRVFRRYVDRAAKPAAEERSRVPDAADAGPKK